MQKPTTNQPTKKYLGLTEEQFRRFSGAAHATWQTIAPDIFQSLADNGERTVMPRSHVVEVTLDADYMRVYGEGGRAYGQSHNEWTKFYDAVLKDWITKHYHTAAFKKLMRQVFPFAYYS
jgi:hypothetical protein